MQTLFSTTQALEKKVDQIKIEIEKMVENFLKMLASLNAAAGFELPIR